MFKSKHSVIQNKNVKSDVGRLLEHEHPDCLQKYKEKSSAVQKKVPTQIPHAFPKPCLRLFSLVAEYHYLFCSNTQCRITERNPSHARITSDRSTTSACFILFVPLACAGGGNSMEETFKGYAIIVLASLFLFARSDAPTTYGVLQNQFIVVRPNI
ncbi:MAG TPA: hypothetical protein VI758_08835 [Bacteroidota bacterium]